MVVKPKDFDPSQIRVLSTGPLERMAAMATRMANKAAAFTYSKELTEAEALVRGQQSRDVLRNELRDFLAGTGEKAEDAVQVWLNLKATGDVGYAFSLALRLSVEHPHRVDTADIGRAILVGMDRERTETLCRMAASFGRSAFDLVVQAGQIEADAVQRQLEREGELGYNERAVVATLNARLNPSRPDPLAAIRSPKAQGSRRR